MRILPFMLAAAAALLAGGLRGAAQAQPAAGPVLLEPRISRLLPAPGEPVDVVLEAVSAAAASGVALDLIAPPDLSLDLPEPTAGDLPAGEVLRRRWRLSASRPGAYALQARLRHAGGPERILPFTLVVAGEPALLDTRADRSPSIRPDRDGSFVFRNAHLVAVLLRTEAGYGPLVLYPATRPGAPWSEPVAVAQLPGRVGADPAAFPPGEARLAGNRLRLRSPGETPVEVDLALGRDPWLTWDARLRASDEARLTFPVRAGGPPRGAALFPGVEWVDGDEDRPALPVAADAPTLPLMAASQGETTVAVLWQDPAAVGTFGSAPDDAGGGTRMDLSASGSGALHLSGRLLVLRETPDPVAAVRAWVAAYGAPAGAGLPSAATVRRLVHHGLDRLWDDGLPGWSPALAESPLPPVHDPRAVVAALADAARGVDAARPERAERVLAALRERGPLPPAVAYRVGGVLSALDAERAALQPLLDTQSPDGGWPLDLLLPDPRDRAAAMGAEAGILAPRALPLLRYAAWTGDSRVAGAGLKALALLRRFAVPRGSAVVAFPPRAPSLLAAAEAAECFLLGHLLTGRPDLLAEARRWADAGLTFVHFRADPARPAQQYAAVPTCGLLGGADPDAPVVQWTGLQLARVLQALAAVAPDSLYERVAEGIVASAIRQVAAEGANAGLLPERSSLAAGKPEGLALAPHALWAAHSALEGLEPGISHARVRVGPDRLHVASGATIQRVATTAMRLRLNLRWVRGSAFTTVIGVPVRPLSVEYNSTPLRRLGLGERRFLPEVESEAEPGWNYDPGTGVLILRLPHTGGTDHLEIRWPDSRERAPVGGP